MKQLILDITNGKNGNECRCQNCRRIKDKLVWMEAEYKEGSVGGYVCSDCEQRLETDSTLSNFSVDREDQKSAPQKQS